MTEPQDSSVLIEPYGGFVEAAQGSVGFLHRTIGLDLWLVTAVVEDQQVAVAASPSQLVRPGQGIAWEEGFCSRMSSGAGPRVAPVTADVLVYADRTFGPAMRVSSYLGVPLLRGDGGLYGTLCGFGLKPQPPTFVANLALVEHTARLLSTILTQEGAAVASQQLIERVTEDSERDVLTGLLNRRGWERALEVEESRCRRSGCSATVIVADLDGLKTINDTEGHPAGDAFLRRTADVLRENSRPSDVVARIGGDEFGVLFTAPAEDASAQRPGWLESSWPENYVARLAGRLAAADCPASLGHSARYEQDALGRGLADAWQRADTAMYAEKAAHRRARQERRAEEG
ncbi:MAG: hypothetical protein QOG60_1053 [Frankiaceae bacterium]|jgi:diguanylate cyclase (GGDEF)-like protein|nr:hypothetical protein [Frankiaceae bacterium]